MCTSNEGNKLFKKLTIRADAQNVSCLLLNKLASLFKGLSDTSLKFLTSTDVIVSHMFGDYFNTLCILGFPHIKLTGIEVWRPWRPQSAIYQPVFKTPHLKH
jgi:hypothetical protein